MEKFLKDKTEGVMSALSSRDSLGSNKKAGKLLKIVKKLHKKRAAMKEKADGDEEKGEKEEERESKKEEKDEEKKEKK